MRRFQVLPTLLAAALILSVALPIFAAPGAPGPDMPYGPRHFGAHPYGPWGHGPMGFGPWGLAIGGLFFVLRFLVLVGIVVVIWRLVGAGGLLQRPDSAKQLLRERYARGEIGEEEYRKRFETLG